jgi:hypothetical protein
VVKAHADIYLSVGHDHFPVYSQRSNVREAVNFGRRGIVRAIAVHVIALHGECHAACVHNIGGD